jgi:hypothetical protein
MCFYDNNFSEFVNKENIMKEYIQEMIDDQAMIDEKRMKLLEFMKSENKKLNDNERHLIIEQFKCMEKYSDILDLRIMEAS